eukprot:TRINITY_DN2263_c0_g1_i5.p2 TRINITY_DN2263_c0_g1~~TRINITY_DN2263_c0_g1_i5.p2  ORF type:complete len:257 (+),score=29.40 TRINITY_DN2263_c0_g1_i5:410-1180(+)
MRDTKQITFEDNSIYNGSCQFKLIGELKERVRNGYGVQRWPDGSMYKGHWRNNKASGQGRFVFPNGDVYAGEWEDNKANGRGVCTKLEGMRYEGMWVNDLQNGYGKEIWNNGSKYEGASFAPKEQGKLRGREEGGQGDLLVAGRDDIRGRVEGQLDTRPCTALRHRRERTGGVTDECTLAAGKKAACTAMGSTAIPMEESTKASMCMIGERAMGFMHGQMGDNTRAIGRAVFSMERGCIKIKTEKCLKECGRRVRE